MYEQVTRSIRVRVRPEYLEAQSAPDEGRYFWSYTVEILNEGSETVVVMATFMFPADAGPAASIPYPAPPTCNIEV